MSKKAREVGACLRDRFEIIVRYYTPTKSAAVEFALGLAERGHDGAQVLNLRTGVTTYLLPKDLCSCVLCGNELEGRKSCPLCGARHVYL